VLDRQNYLTKVSQKSLWSRWKTQHSSISLGRCYWKLSHAW